MSINFSIPNIPSLTKTTPDSSNGTIFVPDVKYLLEFSKGDLGIADAIHKSTIMNNVSRSKNINIATTYLQLAGGIVESPEKFVKNGKFVIPQSEIKLDPSQNENGLKALEKSIIQSIFDTQKPYMDMIGQLSNVLIFVEDIIARVLALGTKSMKPKTNPRALGYKQNGKIKTKEELSKLNSLIKNTPDANNTKGNTNFSNNNNIPKDKHWEVESIVYSTGKFDPSVSYTYEYIDMVKNEPILTGTSSEPEVLDKPKTLIIAVFDNEGNMFTTDQINNDSYNLSWLKNSNKWKGSFDYMNDNDTYNRDLYTRYFREYTVESLPDALSPQARQDIINQVENFLTSDNYKNVNDQISGLKTDCYLASSNFSNSNLLRAMDNSFQVNTINLKRKPFVPKKINFNGKEIWIDPESDYDLKLIRIDAVDKDNDNDISSSNPYSTGIYGGDEGNAEEIGQIYRNKKIDKDNDKIIKTDRKGLRFDNETYNKTYYVLEGIDTDNNEQSSDKSGSNSNSGNKFAYYRKKAFFSAIKQFIKLIILIASKLSPAISTIVELGNNPIKFVTDIMKSNLGDNNGTKDIKFMFFSSEFTKKFSSLKTSKNKRDVIKNSVLKNYIVLNKDGSYKFILNGSGFSFLRKIRIGHNVSSDMQFATSSSVYPSNISPKNTNPNNTSVNKDNNINFGKLKFTSYIQGETIDYIGGYDPNKTYNYIYVDQYVLGILNDAQALEDKGDFDLALDKYNEAQKLDPSNTAINDKIKSLKKIIASFGGSAMFSFILDMITLPLEIVLGIIDEILKILKKFTSPTKLQEAISDLVSFKIFPGGLKPLDFFKPLNMLKLAKIEFNVDLFMSWVSGVFTKPLDSYDLNKVLQLPFITSFPTFSASQFKALIFGNGKSANILPLKMLTGILKLFEGIINAIISFFWALLGLGGLIKKPVLKFTKDSNDDISANDIQALLNGTYTDIIDPNSSNSDDPNYSFIYNIQLPDGRTIKQLDKVELEEFIREHSNFTYQYKL